MRLSKKTVTFLSFAVGTLVFVSTAFADMALGSGYDLLKHSAKHTATQMEKELNNFTVDVLLSLKMGEQTLYQSSTVAKFDTDKQATEESSVQQNANGEVTTYHSYSDKEISIVKSGPDETYYVTEYTSETDRGNRNSFTNPFNEEGAPEIEKIIDAVVGNLKDNVQVEERPEGGRVFSGSLTEMQVPALVNAVSSYMMKQVINDKHRMQANVKLPDLESDIFVKKVSGRAVENEAGLLEHVTGEVVLSGKDKSGVQHDITLNAVFKLTDVGSTKVAKPDLSNAKVEKVNLYSGFTSKYVGTYKNNIVIEKDGQFVKIGERTLEITSVESGRVTGKFYETVKPEYADQYHEPYNFTFEYDPKDSTHGPHLFFFTYTNPQGEQEYGQIHPQSSGKIYLELNIEVLDEHSYRSNIDYNTFDSEFIRVFEE